MSDQKPTKEGQLNIELDDKTAEGTYSNLAIINHSVSEFIVDFISVMPGQPKAKVKSRIILTPQHAKRLAKALAENVKSLEALLTGETRRFEIGESSLFLVNAREVAVFDSRVTLNDLSAKLQIAFAKTRFAAGLGFEQN